MSIERLVASDFSLLGRSYTYDELLVEAEDGTIAIVPKLYSKRELLMGLAFMLLVSIPLFGGTLWFVANQPGSSLLNTTAVLVPIWLLAVVGPIAISYFRSEYWARRSPLIAFDSKAETVSVHSGSQIFQRSEVLCLVALAVSGDESMCSEIQLVTQAADSSELDRSVVVTGIGSIELYSGLGQLLHRFTSQAGIPGYFLRNGVFREVSGIISK